MESEPNCGKSICVDKNGLKRFAIWGWSPVLCRHDEAVKNIVRGERFA